MTTQDDNVLLASPDPFGLFDSPWFEDHVAYSADVSMSENMVAYLQVFSQCCSVLKLPPFPPGCKQHADKPVCSHTDLPKAIWHDPYEGKDGRVFYDRVAVHSVLTEESAPRHLVEPLMETMSKSNFEERKLLDSYTRIVEHGGNPQHATADGLHLTSFNRAILRMAKRWAMMEGLSSMSRRAAKFNGNASAGIGYFGTKEPNFFRALTKSDGCRKGYLNEGFVMSRTTAFGMLCRLTASTLDDSKHRAVACDAFHHYLSDSETCEPIYDKMKMVTNPTTFGSTLDQQSVVGHSLIACRPDATHLVVGDFPGFDIGKLVEIDGNKRFYNGLRSFIMRICFMIMRHWFAALDIRASISLSFQLAKAVFKRITFRTHMWTFTETAPSGIYAIYVLDSIACDLMNEYVAIFLGDPQSYRVVGGDDSISALVLASFSMSDVERALLPINTTWAPPPKSQIQIIGEPGLVKFHGHYSLHFSPYRDEIEALMCLLFMERKDNTDREVFVGRAKGIFLDSGRRYVWIAKIAARVEAELGRTTRPIEPMYSWADSMWHAPNVIR